MQQKTNLQTDEKEHRTPNSGFAKKRVQWLIEHSTSHQILWYVDSLVLRNSPPSQSPKTLWARVKRQTTTNEHISIFMES